MSMKRKTIRRSSPRAHGLFYLAKINIKDWGCITNENNEYTIETDLIHWHKDGPSPYYWLRILKVFNTIVLKSLTIGAYVLFDDLPDTYDTCVDFTGEVRGEVCEPNILVIRGGVVKLLKVEAIKDENDRMWVNPDRLKVIKEWMSV